MNKHQLYVGIFCLFWGIPFQLWAKNPQELLEKANALNHCVDFLNQGIECLWLGHKALEAINQGLIQAKSGTDIPRIYQTADHYATELQLARRMAEQDLEKVGLNNKINLGPFTAGILHFQHKLSSLYLLLHQKENPEQAYQILDEFTAIYDALESHKNQLYDEISQIHGMLAIQEERKAYELASGELNYLIELSAQLLKAFRAEDPQQIQRQAEKLRQDWTKAWNRRAAITDKLDARPGSTHDPQKRYESVLLQIQDLLTLTQRYQEPGKTHPAYRVQGAHYYFYNHQHNNKFSRKGEGLIDQYNRFIQLSPSSLLKMAGMTNWFLTVRPEKGMTIEMQSAESQKERIQASNLVFLLDVSGSMRHPNKFPLFQRSFIYMMSKLSGADRISIVIYSGAAKTVLDGCSPSKQAHLSQVIHQISAEGKTQVAEGLTEAYKVAQEHFIEDGNNQIVMISDGGFELDARIEAIIKSQQPHQITLNTFYLGQQEEKARHRLEILSKWGLGTYAYLRPENAHEILMSGLKKAESP